MTFEEAVSLVDRIKEQLYTLACYDTTQRHTKAISQLETKEEIEAYNFKTGYPRKLNFSGYPIV